jgi:hypothetical protein
MITNTFIPIFILVFLIICFIVFLWARKRQREKEAHTPKQPKHSVPNEVNKEGFQVIAENSYQGALATGASGSRVGSYARTHFKSQFDINNVISQMQYGEWETTAYDKYYDDYENNELYAIGTMAAKLKDITPAPPILPEYGGMLGAFDSDSTKIPWDKDNESSVQSDIVWGHVSDEASKSIFLKVWMQQIAISAANMQPCGENSGNFCYHSPLLNINTRDPKTATLMKLGEGVVQGIGQNLFPLQGNTTIGEFKEKYTARREAIHKFFSSQGAPARALGRTRSVLTMLGTQLRGIGDRVLRPLMKFLGTRVRLGFLTKLNATKAAVNFFRMILLSVSNGLALIFNIASAVPGGQAAIGAAVVFNALALSLDIFFGIFGNIMMAVEAIINPIIDALFHTGGECIPGTKRMSHLVNPMLLAFIANFIPAGSLLQTFDPYVCWAPDASVHLMIPHKIPAFMSDRTLSLVYHALWTSGQSANVPAPQQMSIEPDPLPPNFRWIQNDPLLSQNPNANFISAFAKSHADAAAGLTANSVSTGSWITSGSTGSGELPKFVAVEICPEDTDPSPDGTKCMQKVYNTNVKAPRFAACAQGEFDDGFNCWRTSRPANCTGGQLTQTIGTTWDNIRGFYAPPVVTPLVCGGTTYSPTDPQNIGITQWYNQRVACDNDANGTQYEKDTGSYLCYAKCSNSYSRLGALCKGATSTRDRAYRYATHSAYQNQITPNILTDLTQVTIPYCDFSSPTMLNRMAQFYYNNSLNHPQSNPDGTISIQVITHIYGVTASSELSCDLACSIDFITYDPVTGGNYYAVTGCSYPDDPAWNGCHFCYRRFYFIRGDNDPPKVFTVTGCTFTDYTAPDAMVKSSDIGTNLVPSIPKKFDVVKKEGSIVDRQRLQDEWNSGRVGAQMGIGLTEAAIGLGVGILGAMTGGMAAGALAARAAARAAARVAVSAGSTTRAAAQIANSSLAAFKGVTVTAGQNATQQLAARIAAAQAAAVARGVGREAATQMAANIAKAMKPGYAAAFLNLAGGIAGGAGGGMLGAYTNQELTRISRSAILPEYVDNGVNTFVTGPDMYNLSVVSNNNWFTINHGAVYEAAPGYIPVINFCEQTIISELHCAHKYVIRDMVDKYHNEFPTKHIRQITALEPRGRDGCYYKFVEVDYDPVTNIEEDIEDDSEIILQHRIKDYATCTYESTAFNMNVNDISYPIRSYVDPSTSGTPTPRTIYPTRNTVYTSDLLARYVRVRPPIVAAGATTPFINLSQLAVFDISGFNISIQQPAYGTSVAPGAAPPSIAVNGNNSPTSTIGSLWQPATANPSTEYWEVDLGKNINIAEVVYFGGIIADDAGSTITGRNKGIRIQFLYTNGANDPPIHEVTLPTDESTQYISLSSSSYTIPRYPVAGPIMIPRPVARGMTLGIEKGCINKCEHKPVMDSLISQYNAISPTKQIVKILRGITATTDRCEYQAEVLINDMDKTSDVYDPDSGSLVTAGNAGKHTLVKQYLAINVLPTIKTVGGFPQVAGNVFARYVRITPSFTPGTVLAVSNIRVLNAVPDGSSGAKKAGYDVARNKNTTYYNEYYELNEMQPPPMQSPDSEVVDGDKEPEEYPHGYMARNNDHQTFFQVDLGDNKSSDFVTDTCMGRNYEIHTIEFYGMMSGQDVNIRNGIKGIRIELYKDQPDDQENCCNGKYPPVYVYTLPSDELEHKIVVSPPAACEFAISGEVTVLEKPHYLQENSPAFTTTDTSGGVFTFSGFLKNVQNTWNNILPMKSEDVVAPITENVKESDRIVNTMLETVSAAQTLAGTSKTCKDPEILKAMMTAYNIARGPKDTEEIGVTKSTMLRILKSGQATPNTCDVMFEDLYELYDDYIEDITDKDSTEKRVKAVRFTFDTNGVPARDAAGTRDPKLITDISANAIGLLTNYSTLDPVFSGPSYAVDCRNPGYIAMIKAMLEQQGPKTSGGYLVTSSFKSVKQSFQSTPLSCEYVMSKDALLKSKTSNFSYPMNGVETCVKAVFTLGADGKTTSLTSVKEYYSEDVTFSSDYTKSYLNGTLVDLPSIFFYDPTKKVSKRVNATPQAI